MKETAKNKNKHGLMTTCIHAGNRHDDVHGAIATPIYMTSNYRLPTDGTPVDWSGIHSDIYLRNGHTNQFVLQDKLSAIEGAEDCVVLASGVAALAAVFTTFLKAGDHVVVSQVCYSATSILFHELLPEKYGMKVTFVNSANLEEVKAAITPETKLVHIETPGNPTTEIADIAAIAASAHAVGAMLTIDSTFASPLLQKPLALGADLVIHSMTKYINGHGDALGGAVLGSTALIDKIKTQAMVNFGGIISPMTAWLICRGLATLPLRMKQYCETGMKVAQFLENHPAVRFVYYPGLDSHPQHELAAKQMKGFSGMMCFDIKGDETAHTKFLSALTLICHAVSLGDLESLIVYTQPDSPKMQYYPEIFRDGFFRFSLGLEDAEDIIADLQGAFAAAGLA